MLNHNILKSLIKSKRSGKYEKKNLEYIIKQLYIKYIYQGCSPFRESQKAWCGFFSKKKYTEEKKL